MFILIIIQLILFGLLTLHFYGYLDNEFVTKTSRNIYQMFVPFCDDFTSSEEIVGSDSDTDSDAANNPDSLAEQKENQEIQDNQDNQDNQDDENYDLIEDIIESKNLQPTQTTQTDVESTNKPDTNTDNNSNNGTDSGANSDANSDSDSDTDSDIDSDAANTNTNADNKLETDEKKCFEPDTPVEQTEQTVQKDKVVSENQDTPTFLGKLYENITKLLVHPDVEELFVKKEEEIKIDNREDENRPDT